MKIPKFTSETKSLANVGNSPLNIQANPSALSLGNRARANFGNVVADTGNTMVNMGTQMQQIKNTTDAQVIKNEVHRVTEDLKQRAIHLPEGVDAENWMNTELLKVQDAFTNGGNYTPPSVGVDDTFEEKTYNLGGRTDWNSAVKKSMSSTFLDSNNLAGVAMKKISATRYFNQLTAQTENEKNNLIDSVIFNQDTPEGQIAFDNLFGSEEGVLPDGNVKPAIQGLLEQKLNNGLYKDGYQGYLKDLRDTQTAIAEGFGDNIMIQASLSLDSEDIDIVDDARDSLSEYADALDDHVLIDDGKGNQIKQHKLFPQMLASKRLALRNSLISKRKEIRDDFFNLDKQKFNKEKREREQDNLKHTLLLLEEMDNNETQFTIKNIETKVKENLISVERGQALKKIFADKEAGIQVKASVQSNIIFNQELSKVYDEEDLNDLEKDIETDFFNNLIGREDFKSRITQIESLRNGNDLDFKKNVLFFTKNLKQRIGVIDGIVNLGDEQKQILSDTLVRFNRMTAPDQITKDGKTFSQLQKTYNVIISDFFKQNSLALDQIVSSKQAPLPNPEVMNNFKRIYNVSIDGPDNFDLDLKNDGNLARVIGKRIAENPDQFLLDLTTAINQSSLDEIEQENELMKAQQLVNMFRYYDPNPPGMSEE